MLAGALSTVLTTVTAQPAFAAANTTIADWEMNEPPAGAQSMIDSSGNGINGSIGSAIKTGFVVSGATGYDWTATNPTAPPPKPERLVQIPDARLNPGTRDFAVTVRFRTTHSYGNMIQKGQPPRPAATGSGRSPTANSCACSDLATRRATSPDRTTSTHQPVCISTMAPGTPCGARRRRISVTMTIDGTTVVQSKKGRIGPIANDYPMTIGGKINCDQVTVTCDYFAGDIDYVHIEASSGGGGDTTPPTVPGKPTGQASGPGRSRSTGRRPPTRPRRSPTGSTATASPPRWVRPPRRPSPTRRADRRINAHLHGRCCRCAHQRQTPRARPRTRSRVASGGDLLR